MKECRFDHILIAVEALKEYSDTCASTTNTMGIIKTAHGAIHALEALEKTLPKGGSRRNGKARKSALAECDEKISALTEAKKEIADFFADNRTSIDTLLTAAESLGKINAMAKTIEYIALQIDKRKTDLLKQL